jgi:hypothetical protein
VTTTSGANGKGDARRPRLVTKQTWDANYSRVFRKKASFWSRCRTFFDNLRLVRHSQT